MKTLILGVLTYFAGTLGYIALAQSSTSVPPADSCAGSVAGAVVGDAPSAASNDWPFIIIRHTPAINAAPEVFARLMESHFRYPRACDEFWFAATGRGTKEATLEEMKKANAAFRPLCEKAGVKFSFQQGVTLGHGGVRAAVFGGCLSGRKRRLKKPSRLPAFGGSSRPREGAC